MGNLKTGESENPAEHEGHMSKDASCRGLKALDIALNLTYDISSDRSHGMNFDQARSLMDVRGEDF